MATLEWGDTFDHYIKATTASSTFASSAMSKKWTSIEADDCSWQMTPEFARPSAAGGNGFQIAYRYIYKTLPLGAQATRCFSMWFNPRAYNATAAVIVAFQDGTGGNIQLDLRTTGTGAIAVTRNGTVLTTSTNTLTSNTWYWLEFKATIHNTTGVYEVKVNGSSVNWIAQVTGANTRGVTSNNQSTAIRLGGSPSAWWYDDVVVTDDFPGQIVGAYLRPVAPGNYTQWTANSGNNHGAVAHLAPDDDSSFNQSATSGNIDTFAMEKMPVAGTPTILGIQHVIYARQDAGVARTLRPKQRSSGTDYNGTSANTGASYAYITEAKSVNPATSAAYTKTSLEAAEMGYENV